MFVFLFVILFLILVTKKLNPILLRYSQLEARRFTTVFIRHAINEVVQDEEKLEDIYITNKTTEGQIQTIDFDQIKVNRLLKDVSASVQQVLVNAEVGNTDDLNISNDFRGERYKKVKNGIVCEIPAGALLGSGIFANLGPKIPFKWYFVGQVITNLETNIKEYGINNVYLELNIHVEVIQKILLPVRTEEEVVALDIPIGIKVIQGSIPNYYGGFMNKNSASFSLPMTE